MAHYQLNKDSIREIMLKAQKRFVMVKQKCASATFWYLLNFGYHAVYSSGPWGVNTPGWSWYYAANWNYSVGTPDRSVIRPFRDEEMAETTFRQYVSEWKAKSNSAYWMGTFAGINDPIYVLNPVYYGSWLNDGGRFPGGNGLGSNRKVQSGNPNHFMELANAYVRDYIKGIVEETIEETET